MNGHGTRLIQAYSDGELSEHQTRLVERHLKICPACREEMQRLRALSRLLGEAAEPLPLITPERFAAQVALRLPRREMKTRQKALLALQNAVPFGLVGLWGFVQALFLSAFFLQVVLQTGLIPGLTLLFPQTEASLWASLLELNASADLRYVLNLVLRGVTLDDPFIFQTVVYVFAQFIVGGLFCAWLAAWFLSKTKIVQAGAR